MNNIPGRQKLQEAYLALKKIYIHFKEMKLAFVIKFSEGNAKEKWGKESSILFCIMKNLKLTYLDFYLTLHWQIKVKITVLEGLYHIINYLARE